MLNGNAFAGISYVRKLYTAVLAVALTGSLSATPYDSSLGSFPRLPGEIDDTARIQRAVDATSSGVLYIPKGTYEISAPVVVTNMCSLDMHKSAILRAAMKIPFVLKINNAIARNSLRRKDDRWADFNTFVRGGRIDGNGLASCMALDGFWHYTLSDTTFLNAAETGLRVHGEAGGCELIANNLYFICVKSSLAGNTAIYTTGGDSHYTDCVVVDYTVGFRIAGGSNRFTRCHVWGGPVPPKVKGGLPEMLENSICFWIDDTNDVLLRDCYADTGKTGYLVNGDAQLFGCRYFNNRRYRLDDITVIDHQRGKLLVSGCNFMSGGTPQIKLLRKSPGAVSVWRDNQCDGQFSDASSVLGILDYEADQNCAHPDEWEYVSGAPYVFSSPPGEFRAASSRSVRFPASRKKYVARFPDAGPGRTMIVRVRALDDATRQIELTFQQCDGRVWGTNLEIGKEWKEYRIDLKGLRYFSHWRNVPPMKDAAVVFPDANKLQRIGVSFGKWLCADTIDASHGFEIESIKILGK